MHTQRFTPGPWRTGAGDFPTIYDRKHDKVAHCLMRPEDENTDGEPTRLANAKLVAAAPDLLEALQGIMSEYAGISDKWMAAARAAVTKATGHNAKVNGAGTASAGLPGYAAGENGERK